MQYLSYDTRPFPAPSTLLEAFVEYPLMCLGVVLESSVTPCSELSQRKPLIISTPPREGCDTASALNDTSLVHYLSYDTRPFPVSSAPLEACSYVAAASIISSCPKSYKDAMSATRHDAKEWHASMQE